MTKPRCPHCGNQSPKLIQDNGEKPTSPDLTLLCMASVAPKDWAFTEEPDADQIGEDGKVPCGMQWDPNA